MYTVCLATFIGFAIGSFIAYRISRGKPSLYLKDFMALGIGAGIGCIVGLLAAVTVMTSFVPRHPVVLGPATLVAMRSSDGISGTFLFGSGSIGSEASYNFLYQNADGSLTPNHITADSLVRIIEDNDLKDVGYWSTTVKRPDLSSPWASWALLDSDDYVRTVKQEFRVPVGAVVHSFSVQ